MLPQTLAPTIGKPSHCLKVCVAAGIRSPVESLTRPSSPKELVAPFRLAVPSLDVTTERIEFVRD